MDLQHDEDYLSQLRLFLEEVCCDMLRFEGVQAEDVEPGAVRIDREFYLDAPDTFADIRVEVPGRPAHFVEVKYGYPAEKLLSHTGRKYGPQSAAPAYGDKVVLVIDTEQRSDWKSLEAALRASMHPGLSLEVWNESCFCDLLRKRFNLKVIDLCPEHLIDIRHEIDRIKGFHAFGGDTLDGYQNDPLTASLLSQFGFWRLRQCRQKRKLTPREIFPPGSYRGVAVVMADISGFSSFMRDTPDAAIVRDCLTSFYSKSRYQIINNGGMLYQFVGDEVIGLFDLPEHNAGFIKSALETAQSLVHIGIAVANHWQRRIDRVQASKGVHIGIAVGDLQIVSLRPFSRTYLGALGDCINMTARLMAAAKASEIIVSNSFYRELDETSREIFQEIEPIEAHNVGRIKAWKLNLLTAR